MFRPQQPGPSNKTITNTQYHTKVSATSTPTRFRRGAACESRHSAIHPENRQCRFEALRPPSTLRLLWICDFVGGWPTPVIAQPSGGSWVLRAPQPFAQFAKGAWLRVKSRWVDPAFGVPPSTSPSVTLLQFTKHRTGYSRAPSPASSSRRPARLRHPQLPPQRQPKTRSTSP
jgi:hypothetical protein